MYQVFVAAVDGLPAINLTQMLLNRGYFVKDEKQIEFSQKHSLK